MNSKTVLKYASDQDAKFLSVRFTDLPGSWHHLTFPIGELDEDKFEEARRGAATIAPSHIRTTTFVMIQTRTAWA